MSQVMHALPLLACTVGNVWCALTVCPTVITIQNIRGLLSVHRWGCCCGGSRRVLASAGAPVNSVSAGAAGNADSGLSALLQVGQLTLDIHWESSYTVYEGPQWISNVDSHAHILQQGRQSMHGGVSGCLVVCMDFKPCTPLQHNLQQSMQRGSSGCLCYFALWLSWVILGYLGLSWVILGFLGYLGFFGVIFGLFWVVWVAARNTG